MGSGFDDNVTFSDYSLDPAHLEKIELILEKDLIQAGVHSALLIDMAGNIIAKSDDGECEHDMYSLAALASANFAAVDTMASRIVAMSFCEPRS